MNEGRSIYEKLTEYVDFFTTRSYVQTICPTFADWSEHTLHEWELMYDYLFRGTHAGWEVPLWASVSREEKVLLNQTTLEVIRFYHKWGYNPIWIEGNPPDYLGEQLRFLLHLMRAPGESAYRMNVRRAMEEFVQEYALSTAQLVWKTISGYDDTYVGYQVYLEELVYLLAGEELYEDMELEMEGIQYQPIPDEPLHEIPTAGINNCGGICVIRPAVQEDCMLSISTDSDDHHPQIRACVRGRGYRKTFLNSGRLRYPMKRVGPRGSGTFERISWNEAVDILTDQWVRIRNQYGPASRFTIQGEGVKGILRPEVLVQRLLALDGGYLGYFNGYSAACIDYISEYLFGTSDGGNSAADVLNTKLLILWADNSAETIFGPERNYYLAQLKGMGIRIVVIDPRLSQTGIAYADDWLAIRPSTDAALADAMAYVIWSEGLQDQEFMDRYCIGFDEEHMPEGVPEGESYHSYLFGRKDGIEKTPEWAETITGIEADRIRELARAYATTKPARISAGLGAQRHGNGEQSAKGICMLACLTGNLGIPGGGSGGNAVNIREHTRIDLFTNQAENPYPGKIPLFLWPKAIEQGMQMTPEQDRLKGVHKLETNIKMIFNVAGNALVNQHSDINSTTKILRDDKKCEFIVCSDIFMTPSVRYADLVLPATSVFEGENIIPPWAGSNYLLKNNQVIKPLFECRFEWEWLVELADKLGLYGAFTDGKPKAEQWLRENYELLKEKEPELPDYDTFSERGGWQFRKAVHRVAFEEEIADPLNHPFHTPSGKIEIFSKRLFEFGQPDEIPAIPRYISCPEGPEDQKRAQYPLQLIGWHTRRRCHSIHDNNEWQEEIEKPSVWIHPKDAKKRKISQGELVEVFNDRGVVRIAAFITERIREGVVAMAQGAWYTPDKNGIDTRGCINVLTSSKYPTPLAKGNPQHTNLVEIRKRIE